MRAVVQPCHGGVEVLEVVDVPDPSPAPGDVLIAVEATTVNHLDILQRRGPPLLPGFSLPHTAGMDVVGAVVAVGADDDADWIGRRVLVNPALHCGACSFCLQGDDGFCPGVRVVGGNHPGGYAELVVVPATHVHRVPVDVDPLEAATVPTIYSTAWHALMVVGQLRAGETLLVHAAGSGVSVAAIQLATRIGARVIATAGSQRKLDLARDLGAEVVVNNRDDDVVATARRATNGRGVDLVFDHVGPALFQASLFSLAPRGRLVFCGTTSGAEATFGLSYAYHFGLRLLGADPYSYAEFGDMLAYYWRGGFRPVIDAVLPLAEVREAQRRVEAGEVLGKVVLVP